MKYYTINFRPPKAVSNEASKGLEYRRRSGGKGGLSPSQASKEGIGSGVQRAINLKNRTNLSPKTVKRMKSFFDRHRKNKEIDPKFKKEPWKNRGYVAWLLWGGDSGDIWSHKIVEQMLKEDAKKVASNYLNNFLKK